MSLRSSRVEDLLLTIPFYPSLELLWRGVLRLSKEFIQIIPKFRKYYIRGVTANAAGMTYGEVSQFATDTFLFGRYLNLPSDNFWNTGRNQEQPDAYKHEGRRKISWEIAKELSDKKLIAVAEITMKDKKARDKAIRVGDIVLFRRYARPLICQTHAYDADNMRDLGDN
ncbi:hypothetical protein FO519_006842 [Halicephalobus sp. NKZ332]|nr:hypothetical protein FO519_006842 [Halicephalobus sp. NKZ332]